ncbi:hypothetical protein DID88_001698 [Monilinia fructigena]|uniref:beta-glucosidase n=1 Tax=Monilinia fructigena TaxID=38457 RepID=A0A395IWI8_9HELO|nr:hypothetical protein DID88_001698 [Monilinia fructigena]
MPKRRKFVSQLTVLEKVNLTTGVGWEGESCVGNTGTIPRINFPGICLQDSPLGIRFTDYNSAFPSGMNAAATWSYDLINARGPLGRLPAGGRNWEGFSPDPVLTGLSMAATIEGIQDAGVVACAKHYIMNEQEHFREPGGNNAAPFADAVRAGAGAVMCSYNRINQSYGSENSWTLNYLLKNELDFQGFVVSDWWAQHSGVASALAGLDMTMAGDQNLASGNTYWGTWLTNAVLNGTVPQWRLDDMVVRIMSAYYKVGRDTAKIPVNFNSWNLSTYGYQHPLANEDFTQINQHVNVQDSHAKLIREIGAKSTVLLKNKNGALPLNRPRSIAVIGEDAHDNPSGPNACGDRGCNIGTLAMGWGSGTANFPYLISPVTALKAQAAKDHTTIRNVSNNYDFAAVAAAAQGASVAIVFANADSGEAFITVDGNQGDRNNLTLWGNGDALIDYVASINENTIVVLHTVGPVIVEAYKNHPNVTAILWAGLPGQESGNSLTDVLYGKVNPQAKSIFTWGKSREDYGVDVEYTISSPDPQMNFNEAPTFGRINYNTSAAQFPPGFHKVPLYIYPYLDGPLITNQSDQAPPHSKDSTPQPLLPAGGAPGGNPGLYDELYTASAKVTNTGRVSGTAIPQLYLSLGGPTDPKVVLRAFDDIDLEPHESGYFTYAITRRDISNWDPVTQNWVISPYPKKIYVGSSSRNLVLSGTLE